MLEIELGHATLKDITLVNSRSPDDASVSVIRNRIMDIVASSSEVPSDINDFVDEVFRADLLIEMSPRKKKRVDTALAAVMASGFTGAGALMLKLIAVAGLSESEVLIIGPVGMLAIGLGAGALFLALRSAS